MYASRFLVLILGAFFTLPASGQSTTDLLGNARSDALGSATTASLSSVGPHANPGSHAALNHPTVLFYARESFGLAALRYGATQVAVPRDWGVPSIAASTFGFEEYREVHLSLGVARRLQFGTSRHLHVGLVGRYHHTSIEGYGSAHAVGLNAGILVTLLPPLQLGAHATNINGASLVNEESIPRTLAVGINYQALDQVTILVDLFKDVRYPATVRGGLEISPVDELVFRIGHTTAPVRLTGGVGVHLGPLRAALAAERHEELGWSPSASLEIQW